MRHLHPLNIRRAMHHLATCVLFVMLALLAGCEREQTPAMADPLIGISEADLIKKLGEPESRSVWTVPDPHFGPRPEGLPPGTKFTSLVFPQGGTNLWVFLVSPEAWQKQKGRSPGPEPSYVISSQSYPKNAVF